MTEREIIGFLINGTIYTGQEALAMVNNLGDYDDIICRQRANFMSACDLGIKWEELAKVTTLFVIDEKGNPQWRINEQG